jgi:hypothetical protein
LGASCSLVIARGSGDWKGPFIGVAAGAGPFSGGVFTSPELPGWEGITVGVQTPGIGAYATVSDYTPWFGEH